MLMRDEKGIPMITSFEDCYQVLEELEPKLDDLEARLKAWQPREIPTFWQWLKTGCKSF